MKLKVLAVYDQQAKAFNRPYFVPATGLGVRAFTDEVNRAQQENVLYQHPDDFTLHMLGEWDEDTGKFTEDVEQPILIRGRDAKREQ